MEFWGAEIKAGMPLKVRPQVDHLIHISQATIDGAKKGESALLYVTVDFQKHVIGTLSQDHIPQISFDLVFEQEFELSHSLSQGSVHFVGYKSPNIDQEEDYPSDSEEEEEEVELPATSTITSDGNASNVVKATTDSKPKAKPAVVKPESDEDDDDESDDEEEDDSEDDGPDSSEKAMDVEEDDEEDDSEEEEEETPKQPEPKNKKRATASASKTPVPAKKTKTAVADTTQKTQITEEKKKGVHTATPRPAKNGGKNPNQSPGQSSGGNKKQFNAGKQSGSNNKGKGKGKGRA